MQVRIQEVIHKLEEGSGSRLLTYTLGVIVMLAVGVFYDAAAFRNLSTREGMDAAQLARNIAEGRGYTTDFVRPFSVHLVERHRADHDPQLKGAHPDLANPPVYPVLLAGALELMPFGYPDLASQKNFSIYLPDLWIAMFNQVLLLVAVGMVFRLARRLFDDLVAWMSAAVFLGTELFWRFSISGLSTMLLVVIFLALVGVLARLEPAMREGNRGTAWLVGIAALAGVLVGVGGLTRYAFGWLIVPLVIWLASLGGRRRGVLAVTATAAFLLTMTPWVTRNFIVSGTPFGTAGFAICENTSQFARDQLERSLNPSFSGLTAADFTHKLLVNAREMVQNDLPKLGGSWVSAFFLVGLLVPFRNPTLGRLRWFLVLCLAVLAVVQALGRGEPAETQEEVTSENLLVVFAPMIFVYGSGLFSVLVEQRGVPIRMVRFTAVGFFLLVACAPLLLAFLPPYPSRLVYPPYYPPWIQGKARMVDSKELIMSDIPWAVAWYGQRQSVLLTLNYKSSNAQNDFYAISKLKPIHGLHLSSRFLKVMETRQLTRWLQADRPDEDWEKYAALASRITKQVTQNSATEEELEPLHDLFALVRRHWVRGAGDDWESFFLGVAVNQEVPTGFPLKGALLAPEPMYPELFLTDTERRSPKTIQSP